MQQATAEQLEAGHALTAGQQIEGGYFAGIITINGQQYGIVVTPKEGELDDQQWGPRKNRDAIEGANSFFDGQANTQAMAAAGSELAKAIQGLEINGHTDWYLPARDELELVYRNLKPTANRNFRLSGDNPSSVPVGYAYSINEPGQTVATDFQEDGEQALKPTWYWSSTQASADGAWMQDFADGDQNLCHKLLAFRARAVRRFLIN
ncbi:MAG: DUF1566 domain-containing protein [Pseudomonadales bacterium]|nr:DUF1566 domain-containing protein [Pseudomonadales bacterium]